VAAPPSVILLSTVHFRYDPRIVYRMGLSLAKAYQVHVVLPQANASLPPRLSAVALPFFRQLWLRILFSHPLALWHCLRLKSRVVHIHDPELLPLAFVLKWLGRSIIYDVHENVRQQLRFKHSNNAMFWSALYRFFDQKARQHFQFVLAETSYQQTYPDLAKPAVTILNYPSLAFFEPFSKPSAQRREEVFYIGQISLARGIDTLIVALAQLRQQGLRLPVRLFGGLEFDLSHTEQLRRLEHFEAVEPQLHFLGKTNPALAFEQAHRAFVGLALLKPIGDFAESYPTKIFEYMAVGLPVITSDFPLYRSVVEAHGCGICIDPSSPEQLAEALKWLLDNPAEAQLMGQRGRQAVVQHYQWGSEEAKLLALYRAILSS
jgi:glycosyltransferase involved in cell wall biosynthesis